jgi:hypothetical protein
MSREVKRVFDTTGDARDGNQGGGEQPSHRIVTLAEGPFLGCFDTLPELQVFTPYFAHTFGLKKTVSSKETIFLSASYFHFDFRRPPSAQKKNTKHWPKDHGKTVDKNRHLLHI